LKKIFLLALAIITFSCEKEAEPLTFNGQFKNLNDTEVSITSLNGTNVTIQADEKGAFSEIMSVQEGFYNLNLGNERYRVYLKPGMDLSLYVDLQKSDESFHYQGSLASENNYLFSKREQLEAYSDNRIDILSQEEADFLETMDRGTQQDLAFLGQSEGISTRFQKLETKNILYTKALRMANYPSYYAYYNEKDIEETSEEFKNQSPDLNLNSLSDYINSIEFRSLVRMYFQDLTETAYEKDSNLDYYATYLEIIDQSDFDSTLKGFLAYDNARMAMTYTEDLESYYKTYLSLDKNSENNESITAVYDELLQISAGKESPIFENYENFAGGTTSLADLKGKYVYMDIWAQWCGPCKREIPYLKEIEAEYHDKNIEFVSISIDRERDYDKWRAMVEDKELSGIQLLADKDWESQFVKEYLIKGIPRFILVDPQGKIVNSNAPRPSDQKLKKVFNDLNI
jgi:thiol-disulfide isomerase/thioredoxin